MHNSLLPQERPRVYLQDRPSPLARCASEDTRQQEKNLLYPRITAVIQLPRFDLLSLGYWYHQRAYHSQRWKSCFIISGSDSGAPGSYSWFASVMAKSCVTFWLNGFFWVVLDLLGSIYDARRPDSGSDHAVWPVNSPIYTRFQESPAGETRICSKCTPAF